MTAKTRADLRLVRRQTQIQEHNFRIASLWPKKKANLGTLIRTCDAVGAAAVIPYSAHCARDIKRGNTIGLPNSPIEWLYDDVFDWLARRDERIIGVELAHEAIPIKELTPGLPAVIVLGHEVTGIPEQAWPYLDEIVEIPMVGVGNSLNVQVAGALAAYKVRGWI